MRAWMKLTDLNWDVGEVLLSNCAVAGLVSSSAPRHIPLHNRTAAQVCDERNDIEEAAPRFMNLCPLRAEPESHSEKKRGRKNHARAGTRWRNGK